MHAYTNIIISVHVCVYIHVHVYTYVLANLNSLKLTHCPGPHTTASGLPPIWQNLLNTLAKLTSPWKPGRERAAGRLLLRKASASFLPQKRFLLPASRKPSAGRTD